MPRVLAKVVLVLGAAALLIASVVGFAGRGDGQREPAAEPPAADAVVIEGFAFEPAKLTASVGDTVTWTNKDSAAHTVTSTGGGPLDSGDMAEAATYEATFAEAGTFPYLCTIHQYMQGTVEVVE